MELLVFRGTPENVCSKKKLEASGVLSYTTIREERDTVERWNEQNGKCEKRRLRILMVGRSSEQHSAIDAGKGQLLLRGRFLRQKRTRGREGKS